MIADKTTATVLHLTGELTIFRATEFKDILLAEPFPEVLDLSGVTDIDTAGVQLLMMAKKNARTAQRDFHLVGHSPEVIEVFELLNVVAYFGDPLVMASSPLAAAARSRHES